MKLNGYFKLLIATLSTLNACAESYTCPAKEAVSVSPTDGIYQSKPYVDGSKKFIGGSVRKYDGPSDDVFSPIQDKSTGRNVIIGKMAKMSIEDSIEAVESAKKAWNKGQGIWPQMSLAERIEAVLKVVDALKIKRDEIVNTLKWEICKNEMDAAAEFDRTIKFIENTISSLQELEISSKTWRTVSGIMARIKRAAIGIMLCLGPFNYPFNETYATLIPALLMGNIIIMKIPNIGGLAHILTMEAYAAALPPGVINFVSGSGRTTIPPMMRTGDIDVLAFIGGSKAADLIIKEHPHPHRLKLFLQLEGKNLGIVTESADLTVSASEVMIGSTSYNGQRCTAIKLVFVHESVAQEFIDKLIGQIAALKVGLPWEDGVNITPLPEPNKTAWMEGLIVDAVEKGASVVNAHVGGGEIFGTLMRPAIIYPVTKDMRLWHEEQFGPVIPIAVYKDISEIYNYIHATQYGQQAAVFAKNPAVVSGLIDVLSTAVGRVNLNTQCGRSPDSFPFSGRRSSALGTMSITESLLTFSIETVIAAKENAVNLQILRDAESSSLFLA